MPHIPTYDVDAAKRLMLTPKNLQELGITTELVLSLLESEKLKITFLHDGRLTTVSPDGLSINESTFGNYPGASASQLGWISYMNIGAPLIEERANITQPPADLLSSRSYENREATATRSFQDSVEFSISNTISWSLEGTAELTLADSITSEQSSMFEKSLTKLLETHIGFIGIAHNHKDDVGSEAQSTIESGVADSATVTGNDIATGSGTQSVQLMIGVTGGLSGSITTGHKSNSTVSGQLAPSSRVKTMATQRRQVKQYIYELPVTFGGYVALHYPQPVPIQNHPPQNERPAYNDIIAQQITLLELVPRGRKFRPKGIVETVSTLGVDHIIFDGEALPNQNQPFNKDSPRTK